MILDGNAPEFNISADSHHLSQLRSEFPDYELLVSEAKTAQDAEHEMTILQCFKRYPKAIAWSLVISAAIIMEGYDLTLVNGFFAQPQFRRFYGVPTANGEYTITAAWQAGLQNGVQVGSIFGLTFGGWINDKLGYRKTMMLSLAMITCFIFLQFFAVNITMLLFGQITTGFPLGIFQANCVSYASEVAPARLRHFLTAYVNLCWVFGQVIASGTLRGVLNIDSQWAYRLPFAIQWVWPIPIMIGCYFATESPWWQVRHGHLDAARKTIHRLNRNISDEEVNGQLALIMHTNAMEKAVSEGTQYWDLFKGTDRRRTEIACGTWIVQNACGSAFIGWSTYFLQQAGMDVSMAFTLTIINYAIGALGTMSSWVSLNWFGRKTIFLGGLIVQTIILVIIGGLGFISEGNSGASWAIGGLLIAFAITYQSTCGPACYVIVSEVSSTRLRAKTVVAARICYNLVGIINNIIMPYFLNENELNWGGRTGLFWAGLGILCIIWTYFRQPEMRNRTYGELDTLFEQRVSARKFRSAVVNQFLDDSNANVDSDRQTITGDEKAKDKARSEQWVEREMPSGTAAKSG